MGIIAASRLRATPIFINTYFGNVADIYPNVSDLATALGTTQNNIDLFETDSNNNIRCSIIDNYSSSFSGADLSFYYDFEGKGNFVISTRRGNRCIDYSSALLLEQAFRNSPINCIIIPNVTNNENIDATAAFAQCEQLRRVYMPKWFNTDVSGTFYFGWLDVNNCVGYFNKDLETINSGNLHPSIQRFLNRSATNEARFVQNTDKPNAVTDLSVSNITTNSVQLDFTAPPVNTNANDFYYVYIDYLDISFEFKYSTRHEISAFYDEITGSGDIITGLPSGTQINLQIQTVDYYHNVSNYSNIVTFTTS
jgi:hypothetical protein